MSRPPPRITAALLRRVTARYLARYATTSVHLRRLLMRRVRRAAAFHGEPVAPLAALVDAEIARLVRAGLLCDARYAEDRARALHRRGASARGIRARLAAKGLRGEVVDRALAALRDGCGDPELAAAAAFARRRRMGPWAAERPGPDERRRQLARLGRAGFSYEVARRVVDAAAPSDLGS